VDAARPAQRDTQITALLPAERTEPLHQGGGIRIPHGVVWRSHQHADASHALALLRARRERPRNGCAAEQRDEVSPVHSITSSARASSAGGTVSPSILAVCALMTSSNLLDCTTGRSAGFAPLRMRPV